MPRYSDIVMDHFNSPRNAGRMECPDAHGEADAGGRSPYIKFDLKLQDDHVRAAMFQTMGCGAAIAASSLLTEMATGRPTAECLAISDDDLDEALGRLPEEKQFCAGIAIRALRDALQKYQDQQKRAED